MRLGEHSVQGDIKYFLDVSQYTYSKSRPVHVLASLSDLFRLRYQALVKLRLQCFVQLVWVLKLVWNHDPL